MSVCPRCGAAYTPGDFHQCETRQGSRRVARGCGTGLLLLGIGILGLAYMEGVWESSHGSWFSMVPLIFAAGIIVGCAGLALIVFFRR